MAVKDKFDHPVAASVSGIWGLTGELGWNRLGLFALGLENPDAGILRTRPSPTGQQTVLYPFYTQYAPRTPGQQACSSLFASGMADWSALSPEEKEEFNERAKRYRLHGVNLFMREYLKSH